MSETYSKLDLLQWIQHLGSNSDDLAEIARRALALVAAGLNGNRVALLATDGWLVTTGGVTHMAPDSFGEGWTQFPDSGTVGYGSLRIESGGDLTSDQQAFASVASGLLAGAFSRLEGVASTRLEHDLGLAAGAVSPNTEFIHRVRNILSVIRAIVRKTAERAEAVEDYAAQLDGRLSALARVQTAMIANAEGNIDLGTLIDDEIVAQSISESRVRTSGPRVPLKAKEAETLGLVVHELTENAIKYGALSSKGGKIDIVWWIDAEPARELRLQWTESGVAVLTAFPRTKGFGHELIEQTLPYQLAARTSLQFRPGGFHCDIAIPLSGGYLGGARDNPT